MQVLSPGWLSVRVLAWTSTIAAAAGAAVLWLNAVGLRAVPGAGDGTAHDAGGDRRGDLRRRLPVVALAHIGRRGTAPSGVLLVTTMASSLLVPLMLRGSGRGRRRRQVADVRPPATMRRRARRPRRARRDRRRLARPHLAGRGRRPAAELRPRARHAASPPTWRRCVPTQAEPIWTTVATGRLPQTSGVRSAARYRARADGAGARRPARLHVRAGAGPLRVPARGAARPGRSRRQAALGDSERARLARRARGLAADPPGAVDARLRRQRRAAPGRRRPPRPRRRRRGDADQHVGADRRGARHRASPPTRTTCSPRPTRCRTPRTSTCAPTRPRSRPTACTCASSRCWSVGPDVAVRRACGCPGLDAVAHYYLRYAEPEAFGDVTDDERRRFGVRARRLLRRARRRWSAGSTRRSAPTIWS